VYTDFTYFVTDSYSFPLFTTASTIYQSEYIGHKHQTSIPSTIYNAPNTFATDTKPVSPNLHN